MVLIRFVEFNYIIYRSTTILYFALSHRSSRRYHRSRSRSPRVRYSLLFRLIAPAVDDTLASVGRDTIYAKVSRGDREALGRYLWSSTKIFHWEIITIRNVFSLEIVSIAKRFPAWSETKEILYFRTKAVPSSLQFRPGSRSLIGRDQL